VIGATAQLLSFECRVSCDAMTFVHARSTRTCDRPMLRQDVASRDSYASVNVFTLHLDFGAPQPPRSYQLNHKFDRTTPSNFIIIYPFPNIDSDLQPALVLSWAH
jgi:hypothetical protein